jgi:predicted nucleotidyltransferase
MRKRHLLDVLLPKTRRGILAALFVQPEKEWYLSELARRLGVPSSSLQGELRDLTAAGILKRHRKGRMVYYQANADSPVFRELRGLMLKTAGLVDVLADALRPLAAKLKLVSVYGSIASGTDRSDSDIDLMVVGTASPVELALPLRRAREVLGREINPTVYTPAEFSRKRAAKDHFLARVFDQPMLVVVNKKDELGEAAGKQQSKPRTAKQGGVG